MAKNNIKIFPNPRVSVDGILEAARNWDMQEVLIIGWNKNGEFTIGGSNGELKSISWLLKNGESWLSDEIIAAMEGEG